MNSRRFYYFSTRVTAAAIVVGMMATAATAKFPDRPVEFICNYGPGGGADQFARGLGPLLSKQLGVAVQVINVVGASGNAGIHSTATAKPDGYTIGVITAQSVAAWLRGVGTLRADDLTFLALGQVTDQMLFVAQKSRFKTYQQVLDYAKKHPNKLKAAMGGYGGIDDINRIYMGGLGYKLKAVPYEKPAERYAAPLGGHVDVMFEEPGDVKSFLVAKQIRPLVVYTPKRNSYFPNVPASLEFKQTVHLQNFRGVVAAKKVSKKRVKFLNAALNRTFASKAYRKFCDRSYTCTQSMSSSETTAFVNKYYDTLKKYKTK